MTEQTSADTSACLLVEAGAHLSAIPLADVVETLRPLPVERQPGMPEGVLGLAMVRGATVPVVDLAALFHDPPAPVSRWVLVQAGARAVALAVTSVLGVRALGEGAVAAGATTAAGLVAPAVAAIVEEGTRAVRVLDVAYLLPAEAGGRG
jgi:purine-binding chemotaxis protein CheW